MMRSRTARALLATATALAAAACSESPQSQFSPSTPRFAASMVGKKAPMMARGRALSQDLTRSFTVTQKGGNLEIPETGLKVKVPSNALPAGTTSMTITITAFAGDQFGYEFEPSGTMFRQPLRFEQDVQNVNLSTLLFQRPVVEYFKSRSDIDALSGTVQTFEDLLTDLDLSGHTVKADIWHFSGYIVAWGRTSGQ